jgi:hypothetical protein
MTAIAGKTDAFENAWLLLLFNNTAIANVGDAGGLRATATAGSLYVSLHTADPTEEGNQGSSEIAYTSYARVAKARSGAGWTVTASSVVPASAITFPTGGGGSGTATFFGIGVSPTAADSGLLLYAGSISPSIVCGSGVTPQLSVATSVTEA